MHSAEHGELLNRLPGITKDHPQDGSVQVTLPPGVLPRHELTPGAIDPRVTQRNIRNTICRRGYTATVRPPFEYTKEGSTISGLMDSIATFVSLALQHGVPLEVLCAKFSHTRFEPSGWSGNPKIGYATSLMDNLFRWMELKFLTKEQGELFEPRPMSSHTAPPPNGRGEVEALGEFVQFGDAPACNVCGSLMLRSGTCYRCTWGNSSGCS